MRKARLLPNANQPDQKYPFGSYKGSSTPEAKNGTPILADTANDVYGAHSAILKEAGMEANGVGEGVGSSQVLDAIKKLIQNSATSLNNSLQAIINKLRSDMVQGDKDTLVSANKYTDDSIQIQDGKAKQYASTAKNSSVSYTNEQIKVVNERISGITKSSLGLENVQNYGISDLIESKSNQYASSKAVYDLSRSLIRYVDTQLIDSYTRSTVTLKHSLFDYERVYFYYRDDRSTIRDTQVHEGRVLKENAGSRTHLCGFSLIYMLGSISLDGKTITINQTKNCVLLYIVGTNTYRGSTQAQDTPTA